MTPERIAALETVVKAALCKLDALPAAPTQAQAQGETVEVAVWRNDYGGVVMSVAGSLDDRPTTSGYWRRLGTTRLPIITTVAPGGGE